MKHKVSMPLKMFFGVQQKQKQQEKKRREKEKEEDRVHSRSRSGAGFALGKVRSKAVDMAARRRKTRAAGGTLDLDSAPIRGGVMRVHAGGRRGGKAGKGGPHGGRR